MPRTRTRRATDFWEGESSDDEQYSYREKKLEELENPWVAPAALTPVEPQTKPVALPPRISSLPTPPPGSPTSPNTALGNPWTDGIDTSAGDIGILGNFHAEPGDMSEEHNLEGTTENEAVGRTNSPGIEDSSRRSSSKVISAEEAWQAAHSGGSIPAIASSGSTLDEAPNDDPWDLLASSTSATAADQPTVQVSGSADDLLAFLSGDVDNKTKQADEEHSRDVNNVELAIKQGLVEDMSRTTLGAALAAEPSTLGGDAEAEALIRQVVQLQKGLRAKVNRVVTSKSEYSKQHSENQVLHQYITNLMAATRKMEKDKEAGKPEKAPKRGRRLFG
ncbi:hypothetical protein SpCBS45565_g05138 [Spizellomyces sp. 'palustris']|nr:hypothetical protein SpCBS45565_g05138 [Spizellomyces sp. 'palustris']